MPPLFVELRPTLRQGWSVQRPTFFEGWPGQPISNSLIPVGKILPGASRQFWSSSHALTISYICHRQPFLCMFPNATLIPSCSAIAYPCNVASLNECQADRKCTKGRGIENGKDLIDQRSEEFSEGSPPKLSPNKCILNDIHFLLRKWVNMLLMRERGSSSIVVVRCNRTKAVTWG